MRKTNYEGQKFGRLLVLKRSDKTDKKGHKIYWDCLCDCGNKAVVCTGHLQSGWSKSCGCNHKGVSITHNMTGTRPYRIWQSMKNRTTNKNQNGYTSYRSKNITVCDEWLNSFENFWKDMQEGYSDELTIDRVNNNNGYYKENCRWATSKEQARNTRKNDLISFEGEVKCLSEWAEIKNISQSTLYQRLYKFKWSIEDALTIPVRIMKKRIK